MIAWIGESRGSEALGPVPDGVELVREPGPGVRFAIPTTLARFDPSAMPALEVVQVLSAGVDWIVDLIPDGVVLCTARGARDPAMAEWVLAAILADVKRARAVAEQQAARRWEHLDVGDLAGLRVVVLGHGSIGRAVEGMLRPLGCHVDGVARRARDGAHALDALPALLPRADVLVDLLPLTDATRGLVDAGCLARLPDGALFVNAGRGATVDTDALVAELEAGRLRAVLDVTDPEPLPAEHPLWRAPGAVISPHSAGDTLGADRASWALAGEQLRRWAASEPLVNVVRAGY